MKQPAPTPAVSPQGYRIVTVTLTQRAYAVLAAVRKADGRNASEIMEDAILEYAAKHHAKEIKP